MFHDRLPQKAKYDPAGKRVDLSGLWTCVLKQVIFDATANNDKAEIHEARIWLLSPCMKNDREIVYNSAGVELGAIERWAQDQVAKGWPGIEKRRL